MKKLIIIGFVSIFIIAGLFLWHRLKHPTDEYIRHEVVGAWSDKAEPTKTIEAKPDGSLILTYSDGKPSFHGTWEVTNGCLLVFTTVTNGMLSQEAEVESDQVISINEKQMVVYSNVRKFSSTLLRK